MKRGLESFSSEQVAAYRIFIAFIFLLPLGLFHFRKEFLIHWKAFLGMGLFGNLIPAFLFTKAETGISSALTGMLNSLTPLFTLLLGLLFFRTKTNWVNTFGVLIGLAGAIVMLYSGLENDLSKNLWFGGFVVLATISYGMSVNIIKKYLGNVNAVTATVWSMCFIGPPAGVYLFSTDFISRVQTSPSALSSIIYTSILGIAGTSISVIIFNILIKNTTALFASSVTYLIPIVAIGWGIQDNESFTLLHGAGISLVLSGVYLVNKRSINY